MRLVSYSKSMCKIWRREIRCRWGIRGKWM